MASDTHGEARRLASRYRRNLALGLLVGLYPSILISGIVPALIAFALLSTLLAFQ